MEIILGLLTLAALVALAALGASYLKEKERLNAANERLNMANERLNEANKHLDERSQEVEGLCAEVAKKTEELSRLQIGHAADAQRIQDLQQMQEKFNSLANQVLQKNQKSFLDLANNKFSEHMGPVNKLLEKYRTELQEIEKNRRESQGSLKEQLKGLMVEQQGVREEATRLREALRGSAQVRGRWGEHSLKNAVELAGMSEHCDFVSQQEVSGADGRMRPDMVIRMPGKGSLVVDAKTPLENYLEYLDAADADARANHLRQYAKNLRGHMVALGGKEYWRGLKPSPEFVVMYVPGDHFLAAALEASPDLWEEAMSKRVLIATPTIFLALVRTVAYGWKVRAAEENVARIASLGKELYDRISVMGDHVDKMGKGLEGAVRHYNGFIGSLEGRVLPKAREFRDLGAISAEREPSNLEPLDTSLRAISAPELESRKQDKEE